MKRLLFAVTGLLGSAYEKKLGAGHGRNETSQYGATLIKSIAACASFSKTPQPQSQQ